MNKQKTITLHIVVPDWARWMAQDEDGEIRVFSHKPFHEGAKYWYVGGDGMALGIIETDPPRDWRKTLRRIK